MGGAVESCGWSLRKLWVEPDCYCILITVSVPLRQLSEALHDVGAPLPRDQFEGTASDVEPHLSAFLTLWSKVRCEFSEACSCCQELIKRLNDASRSAESAGSSVNYSSAEESIRQCLEEAKVLEEKVREVCVKRERRWNLSIQLEQLGPSVDKVCAGGI